MEYDIVIDLLFSTQVGYRVSRVRFNKIVSFEC